MSLRIRKIPTDISQDHPPPPHPDLLKHPFSLGIIAPKGSGKTTLICNLLYQYKGYFHAIVVFSPTINNDEKWVWLKRQRLLAPNTALENFIMSQESSGAKRTRKDDLERYCIHTDPDFNGTIPDQFFYAEYDKQDLEDILTDLQELADYLAENGGNQNLKNRILFVFDDLVGSSLFSKHKKNPFIKLASNLRHDNASEICVTQAFNEIPRTVRTQFSAMIIFEIASETEKKVIMKEYGMGMKNDQWERVYKYCTENEFNFLFYNVQKPKHARIMKNFDQVINISLA